MINPRKKGKSETESNAVDAIPKVVKDPLAAMQEEGADDRRVDTTPDAQKVEGKENTGSGNGAVGPSDDEDYDEGVGSGSGQEEDSEEEEEDVE